MLNTFPYNNGHTMIIPNRHTSDLAQLRDYEALGMHRILINLLSVFKKILKPDGFNVGINIGKVAGAGVDKHVHVHLVPRWLGDTNFMPVTADTKVISQGLRDLYNKLKQHIK
jgi:ATP adenylyltransferase